MVKFICLFLPAVVCVGLYEHLSKRELCRRHLAYMYGLDVILINFIIFGVKQYLLQTADQSLTAPSGDMLPSVAFNYLLMGMVSAIGIAIAQVFLSKHAKVTIEESSNED